MWPAIIWENHRYYGGDYINDLKEWALGNKPKHYYQASNKYGVRRKPQNFRIETLEQGRKWLADIVDAIDFLKDSLFK